jgi:hypothetical protein
MQSTVSGKYYEELEPGMVFRHAITRTVTETDNLLFSALTYNSQPLHLDDEFCKNTVYGRRLVNSIFTLGLVVGVGVGDLTLGTTLGNLGFDEITFPKPEEKPRSGDCPFRDARLQPARRDGGKGAPRRADDEASGPDLTRVVGGATSKKH